jgi:hypothetical protein
MQTALQAAYIVRALRNRFLFLLTVTTGEGYLMMIDSAKADL